MGFWVPYALAVIICQRYRWVGAIWMILSAFGVPALSVHLVVKKYRSDGDERIHARSPLGYLQWLIHFLWDTAFC